MRFAFARRSGGWWGAAVGAVMVAVTGAGCSGTVDSLGYNDASGIVLHRMTGPDSYPNAFRDVLGKSDAEIAAKLASAFEQLFHGDPTTQAIYFPVAGQNQAYIQDVLHGDTRTEGIGLGMIISFELDKRDEFDRLWTYAKSIMEVTTGAAKGYFTSSCAPTFGVSAPCFDPYGHEHLLMALLLAHDRWGEGGAVDYAAGAKDLLTVMRHKQDENGGIVDGVTDTFDSSTGLVLDQPVVASAGLTRPSIVTPAFYAMWAQAAADPFWNGAAGAGRALWKAAANAKTGLVPLRARFDGAPTSGGETFAPEAYRTLINIVLDKIWAGGAAWDVDEADRLLQFFLGEGFATYGREFSLDGTPIGPGHEPSLVVANGILALIARIDARKSFIDAVWNMSVPMGGGRYYTGILQMLGLLILSGECRVY